MRLVVLAIVAALTLTGCANQQSVLTGGTSLTAPVTNPIGRNELAAIEASYGIALTAAVNYRRLGLCPRGTTESLTRVCARRDVVLKLQAADRKVMAALRTARRFVRQYPTLNAYDVLMAARAAVDNFRLELATNGVA